MNIVSVSLSDRNLADLHRIRKEKNISNASEAVRSAILDAIEKMDAEKAFHGTKNAVLVVQHSHATEAFVSKTKHSYQLLIKSQNHFCSSSEECIDVFVLHGSFEQIKKMRNAFLKNKQLQKLALVPL